MIITFIHNTFFNSRHWRISLLVLVATLLPLRGWTQQYAGFIDDVRNGTSDSLMNINGVEYYLLFEDYENVHFLSLLSEKREVLVLGPATPSDTLYQEGELCVRLGIEDIRKRLSEMENHDMIVENKFPDLFTRCESVSPCNFKACDTNNFGYKIVVDFPSAEGAQWDFLRFWLINYIDNFTNLDMLYYDDVYLQQNISQNTLPTAVLKREHPEAFEIEDIMDGQAIVDHFRDIYMRQVYYLKNMDFSFPMCYLRIFITPRFVSKRYITFFISTNYYSYGAHDLPLERYITFDMQKQEVVNNVNFFKPGVLGEVRNILAGVVAEKGNDIEDNDLPQVSVFGNNLIFSFQPYQIGSYSDGISHFVIDKERLKRYIQKGKMW